MEDKGGCKGQKMTSDPSTPPLSVALHAFMLVAGRHRGEKVQESYTCCQRVKVRVSRERDGSAQLKVFSRNILRRAGPPVVLEKRSISPFKAIGAQMINVFILFLFQF